jgi:predicted phosphodiesterase
VTLLAVLSDIHGNLPALEAVLNDLAPFKVDQIVIAGDAVNGGAFPAVVAERIMREGWPVIRGNNELYVVDYGTPRAPADWREFTIPPWTIRQLGERLINVIASWPDALSLRFRDAPAIRVVHGSPRSAFESIGPQISLAEIEPMLAGVEEPTLIAGHTHVSMDRQIGRWHVLNPGSVGVPLDGTFEATYMLLRGERGGWQATLRKVPYDIEPLFLEFERLRFVEECGVIGHLIVQEYRTALLHVYPFNAWRKIQYPDQPARMDMLEAFAEVDAWDYLPPLYKLEEAHSMYTALR